MSHASTESFRQFVHAAVESHRGLVYRVAYRALGNAEDAEDVAQEVFLRLVRSRTDSPPIQTLTPWLVRVTLNAARSARRDDTRRRRREALAPVEPDTRANPESDAEVEMTNRALVTALAELPDTLRMPLVLHYHEGLKYREIAVTLGCPEGTVARRIATAKERLRELLGPAAALGLAPTSLCELEHWLARPARIPEPTALAARLHAAVDAAFEAPLLAPTSNASLSAGIGARQWAVLLLCVVLGPGVILTVYSSSGDTAANDPKPPSLANGASDVTAETANASGMPRPLPDTVASTGAQTASESRFAPSTPAASEVAQVPSVAGRVVDPVGHPIAGAVVELLGEQPADADGENPEASTSLVRVAATVSDTDGFYAFFARPELAVPPASSNPGTPADGSTTSPSPESEAGMQAERDGDALVTLGGSMLLLEGNGPRHQVQASALGYAPRRSISFELPAQATESIDLALVSALLLGGCVFGDGYPIPGAVVTIVAHNGPSALAEGDRATTADPAGCFRLDGVPAGRVLVAAKAPGWTTGQMEANAGDEHLRLELNRGGSVSVAVLDTNSGEPLPEIEVTVITGTRIVGHGLTSLEGATVFANLAPASYEIEAGRGPFSLIRRSVVVTPGSETALTLPLPLGNTVSGRVLPAPGVNPDEYQVRWVSLTRSWRGEQPQVTSRCDVAGEFVARNVPAGSYLALLYRTGEWDQVVLCAVQPVEIADGQGAGSVTIADVPSSRVNLVLRLRSNDGLPISAAFAQATIAELGAPALSTHQAADSLALTLPPGRYDLTVAAPDHDVATMRNVSAARDGQPVEVRLRALAPDDHPLDLSSCFSNDLFVTVESRLTLRQFLGWLSTQCRVELTLTPTLTASSRLDEATLVPFSGRLVEVLPYLLMEHDLTASIAARSLEIR
ncbi:MAG: sigma-70 family RNA polymerase sigma factor [Planctomycetota bacterium]